MTRPRPLELAGRLLRRPGVGAGVAMLAVTAGLGAIVATKGHAFSVALGSASPAILAIAVGIELLWIVARVQAWAVCIDAAGGAVRRRTLFRSASLGYLGNILNPQVGLAVRIAALRRSGARGGTEGRRPRSGGAADRLIEAGLAALLSFTLVGALGLSWWVPVGGARGDGRHRRLHPPLRRSHRERAWRGLSVLTGSRDRARIVGLVVIAVSLQVLRNWFVLHAMGANVSLFDSIALLIGMAAIGALPIGPGLGAAACVLILGSQGHGHHGRRRRPANGDGRCGRRDLRRGRLHQGAEAGPAGPGSRPRGLSRSPRRASVHLGDLHRRDQPVAEGVDVLDEAIRDQFAVRRTHDLMDRDRDAAVVEGPELGGLDAGIDLLELAPPVVADLVAARDAAALEGVRPVDVRGHHREHILDIARVEELVEAHEHLLGRVRLRRSVHLELRQAAAGAAAELAGYHVWQRQRLLPGLRAVGLADFHREELDRAIDALQLAAAA